jgi:hypothetical protein
LELCNEVHNAKVQQFSKKLTLKQKCFCSHTVVNIKNLEFLYLDHKNLIKTLLPFSILNFSLSRALFFKASTTVSRYRVKVKAKEVAYTVHSIKNSITKGSVILDNFHPGEFPVSLELLAAPPPVYI